MSLFYYYNYLLIGGGIPSWGDVQGSLGQIRIAHHQKFGVESIPIIILCDLPGSKKVGK